MSERNIRLFCYGSLRDPEVQRALFGRLVEGRADGLPGYRLGSVTIADPDAIATSGTATHIIVDPGDDPADRVPGLVLSLSEAELAIADAYEVEEYARVSAHLSPGSSPSSTFGQNSPPLDTGTPLP